MRTRSCAAVIAALSLCLTACGDDPTPPAPNGGTPPAAKTDAPKPDTPAVTTPPATDDAPETTPAPTITPAAIDFGTVPHGRIVSRAVDVRASTDGFTITRATITPSHLATASIAPLGDGQQRVTVALKAGWAAPAIAATLELHTNDDAHPTLTVAIKGTPVEPPKKPKPRSSPF